MRRLEGIGVVITRPLAAAEVLAGALAREGAKPLVFPALAIEDLPTSPALETALDALPGSPLAIFVSAHAVERGLEAVRRRGPWPGRTAVAAVGAATAQALRGAGFTRVIFPPGRHDSEALAALPELQAGHVSGENVVVFRGEGGRERLKEVLESRGAQVAYAQCYRRVRPRGDPRMMLQAWSRGEIQAVSVLSAETLENFVSMIGEEGAPHLRSAVLVVPHEAIGAHAQARRFARVVVADHGAEGIADALASLRPAS